jgi:hypothetical protein
MEYKIGTYELKCDACGTNYFIQMDYCVELAPVDIKEAWTSDGVPCEIVEEKRGSKHTPVPEIVEVDPNTITRPPPRKRDRDPDK